MPLRRAARSRGSSNDHAGGLGVGNIRDDGAVCHTQIAHAAVCQRLDMKKYREAFAPRPGVLLPTRTDCALRGKLPWLGLTVMAPTVSAFSELPAIHPVRIS